MAKVPVPVSVATKISDDAVRFARETVQGYGWSNRSVSAIVPYPGEGLVGIKATERYLMYQERGTRPHLMWWVQGRAQPLDAKVLTPRGWMEMGSLRVGDQVIAPDGGESVVEGIFSQGDRPIYRVFLADGSSTRASADHLWTVEIKGMRKPQYVWTTEKIREFVEAQAAKGNSRWGYPVRVPAIVPVEYAQDEVPPIAPYTLGALLGDGNIAHQSIYITSVDAEILARVESELPLGMCLKQVDDITYRLAKTAGLRNPYMTALRELNLKGHTCYTKYIPEVYKRAAVPDRIALLQGLFDTDGWCTTTGQIGFVSTSHQLASDVTEVVRSLGGRCSMSERPSPKFSRNGTGLTGRTQYRLCVSSPHNIFHLSRKALRFVPSESAKFRRIVRIEEVGVEPVQCIKVSSPLSLYLTDDFIPTHNTIPIGCKQGDGPHFRRGGHVGEPGYVNIPHRGQVWRDQRWLNPGIQGRGFMQAALQRAIAENQPMIKAFARGIVSGGRR